MLSRNNIVFLLIALLFTPCMNLIGITTRPHLLLLLAVLQVGVISITVLTISGIVFDILSANFIGITSLIFVIINYTMLTNKDLITSQKFEVFWVVFAVMTVFAISVTHFFRVFDFDAVIIDSMITIFLFPLFHHYYFQSSSHKI
jgi:cell shape-determining protein MreD